MLDIFYYGGCINHVVKLCYGNCVPPMYIYMYYKLGIIVTYGGKMEILRFLILNHYYS